ncbi:MAG: STAS domain-containing protein [Leptospirales bacterium]|nr:STAS domain-containing protein [Leptospirales bacterium]
MIEIARQTSPGVQVLIISGKLEPDDAEVFQQELNDMSGGKRAAVLIDLAGVNYICSTALGILISQHRKLRRAEGELKLVVDDGYVRNILHMTMLDRVFPLFKNREDALKTFVAI